MGILYAFRNRENPETWDRQRTKSRQLLDMKCVKEPALDQKEPQYHSQKLQWQRDRLEGKRHEKLAMSVARQEERP